jgi:phospholipid/cholesterol/gamma-HCH transport system substrate-binding protein
LQIEKTISSQRKIIVNLLAAEFKVGLLVVAVASLIAYMSLQVSDDPSFMGRSNEAWFMLPDAGGLVKNSAVKMAGIPMGVIKDIKLQDGAARVDISMRPDVKMHVTATVTIKSQGILGDSHVEITPGSPSDPPLPRGGQIMTVLDKGSLDNVINQVGDIAGNLKEVAKALRESVTEDGTRKHVLGRIVLNIEHLTQDLADISGKNKDKINDIIDEVHGITRTLNAALNDESDEGFKKVWKRTIAHIDGTMKNLDDITGKINRGEGTVGKLVSDEETAESISHAIDGVSEMLDAVDKVSTSFDISSGYLSKVNGAKTEVNVLVQPGIDRYYLLGIVSDPMGVAQTVQTTDTGSQTANYTETKVYSNSYKINAEFAKTFYNFTFRAGLIENYGGFGFDVALWRNKLQLKVDLFNFSQLNVQPVVRYDVWKGIYLFGGIYDALNNSGLQSSYLGAGLFLTNDDLKLLLTSLRI